MSVVLQPIPRTDDPKEMTAFLQRMIAYVKALEARVAVLEALHP